MSDNPFAEPDDDRTVFRPMPGGQRTAARAGRPPAPPPLREPVAAAPPPVPPPVAAGADLHTLVTAFNNPIIAAAAPLLQLLARLRNTAAPPDQGDMRDRVAREMREFERRAREAGVPMEEMRPAHYALCASLDDVVLNTPWGAHGRWSQKTLSATFHGDQDASDGFFDQIRLMRQDPGKHVAVLELMYLCMALGFMGRFRKAPDGAERMERIREQTHQLIAGARGGAPQRLSEHWEGVDAAYRPKRTRFPVWVAACAVVACVAGGFVWVLQGLNQRSDAFFETALAAPPSVMPQIARPPLVQPPPPPPEPPPPGAAERLGAALAGEIKQGHLAIVATPSATILRIPAPVLFPGQNAVLARSAGPLLEHVGQALKGEAGPVRVVGYTDNRPFRTVKFPSNFALSDARAQAVRAALIKPVGEARLSAEGRADADPVAPNTTAEGRETNRRLEIVLGR